MKFLTLFTTDHSSTHFMHGIPNHTESTNRQH